MILPSKGYGVLLPFTPVSANRLYINQRTKGGGLGRRFLNPTFKNLRKYMFSFFDLLPKEEILSNKTFLVSIEAGFMPEYFMLKNGKDLRTFDADDFLKFFQDSLFEWLELNDKYALTSMASKFQVSRLIRPQVTEQEYWTWRNHKITKSGNLNKESYEVPCNSAITIFPSNLAPELSCSDLTPLKSLFSSKGTLIHD